MVEQQTFDNPPPLKRSFMSTIMNLTKHAGGTQSEEAKKEQMQSPSSTGGLSNLIKQKVEEHKRKYLRDN
jgi:hypothetical protein